MEKFNFNDYTIISNTCLGGFIYRNLKRQYDNPFMWNMWNDEMVYDFLLNFNSIDFDNFNINKTHSNNLINRVNRVFGKTNRDIYSIIIDNKYEIYYPHYIENKNEKTPKKSKTGLCVDIFYYDIPGYLNDIYKRRVDRMKKYEPIFILDTINDETIMNKIISTDFNFKVIAGSKTISLETENKSIYTYPKNVAQENALEIIKKFNIEN